MPGHLDNAAQVALLKTLLIFTQPTPSDDAAENGQTNSAFHHALKKLDLEQSAASILSLSDGVVLGHALKDLDMTFDLSQIRESQGSSMLLSKSDNLLAVYHGLFAYIRRSCPDMILQSKVINVSSITRKPDTQGMAELLALLLVAALLGEDNGKYVKHMSNLDSATLSEIRSVVEKMQTECRKVADSGSDADRIADHELDPEEKVRAIQRELLANRKLNSDLHSRQESLQASWNDLERKNKKLLDEVEELRMFGRDDELQTHGTKLRLREMEDLIALQESEISDLNDKLARMKRDVRDLSKKSQRAEELEDTVSELQHANDELSKKANEVKKYRQKVESLLKEHQSLQSDKAEQQVDLDALRAKIQELLQTINGDRSRGQSQNWAVKDATREVAELKIKLIKKEEELVWMQEQRDNDKRMFADLQDQLKPSGGVSASEFPDSNADAITIHGNLEDELSGNSDQKRRSAQQPSAAAEISRLQAKVDVASRSLIPTEEVLRILSENEVLKRQNEDKRHELAELVETAANQQTLIYDMLRRLSCAETIAHSELEGKYEAAQVQLERERGKVLGLQADLADAARDLLIARTALSALPQDKLSALKTFKEAEMALSASLQRELSLTRHKVSSQQAEIDIGHFDLDAAHQRHERFLIDAGQARQMLDKLTASATATAKVGLTDADSAGKVYAAGDTVPDQLLERPATRNEQPEESESDKDKVSRMVKFAANGESPEELKAALDRANRENRLVASAWFSLTARLQSNHVVLQRRPDDPRSWIGKQRVLVSGAIPRR